MTRLLYQLSDQQGLFALLSNIFLTVFVTSAFFESVDLLTEKPHGGVIRKNEKTMINVSERIQVSFFINDILSSICVRQQLFTNCKVTKAVLKEPILSLV
ncbi:MAG: hypothetical protein RJR35_10810 [Thermoanaerobacterales bacterium]|nr:hypothetical protein [Thermoanaerobacterales bacterium]